MAHVRTTVLPARPDLFVPRLLSAQAMGGLTLGNISLDGTTIPAAASKSRAVSSTRRRARDRPRRPEVDTFVARTEHAEQPEMPAGVGIAAALALRPARLANLATAHVVCAARAQAREAAEPAASDATGHERAATARPPGSPPRGRPPPPPTPGPRDTDQDHCTAPASRLMHNRHNDGCDHPDHAHAAVAQDSCLLVARTLSNPPNEHAEAIPPLDALPLAVGTPQAGALDHGSCSATTSAAMAARDREPSIATGRLPPHPRWPAYCAQQPAPPPADASPKVPMADTLQTAMGGALSRWRQWTGEPVLGMSKDLWGCRQGALRGVWAAAGAWCLGCLACNVQRRHPLTLGYMCPRRLGGTGQGVR